MSFTQHTAGYSGHKNTLSGQLAENAFFSSMAAQFQRPNMADIHFGREHFFFTHNFHTKQRNFPLRFHHKSITGSHVSGLGVLSVWILWNFRVTEGVFLKSRELQHNCNRLPHTHYPEWPPVIDSSMSWWRPH